MSRLVYPDVASEYVYPDGRSIPVWYPMGPRLGPVATKTVSRGKSTLKIWQKIVIHFQRHAGERVGFAPWELARALNSPVASIRSALEYHPEVFAIDKEPTGRSYNFKGTNRTISAHRWHLVTPDTKEG